MICSFKTHAYYGTIVGRCALRLRVIMLHALTLRRSLLGDRSIKSSVESPPRLGPVKVPAAAAAACAYHAICFVLVPLFGMRPMPDCASKAVLVRSPGMQASGIADVHVQSIAIARPRTVRIRARACLNLVPLFGMPHAGSPFRIVRAGAFGCGFSQCGPFGIAQTGIRIRMCTCWCSFSGMRLVVCARVRAMCVHMCTGIYI